MTASRLAAAFCRRIRRASFTTAVVALTVILSVLSLSLTLLAAAINRKQLAFSSGNNDYMKDQNHVLVKEEPVSTYETPPLNAPPFKVVKFRTIGHFDRPMAYPNLSPRTSLNLAPTLPVLRFGSYNATLRNRDMVVLIPTISRPRVSYLSKTIHSFLETITETERDKIVVLVSINEISEDSQNNIFKTAFSLIAEFPGEISKGLIEIIAAPREFYMNMTDVPDIQDPEFGVDTPARLYWRSKQTLDYAFMFSYAFTEQIGQYVLLLEDDVAVLEKSVVNTMLEFPAIIAQSSPPPSPLILWYEFCPWGAIGKMFPIKQIPVFVNIMTTIFYAEPVDWQLGHVAEIFACRYYHTKAQCDVARRKLFKIFPRKLFRHVAKVSTAPEQKVRAVPTSDHKE